MGLASFNKVGEAILDCFREEEELLFLYFTPRKKVCPKDDELRELKMYFILLCLR